MLRIINRGKGKIGVPSGWTVNQNGVARIAGLGRNSVGTVSFSASCDNESKFAIDNYLEIRHYLDDRTTRWLTTFDINIRNVQTTDKFGTFSGSSILSRLDVERNAYVNDLGVFQRDWAIPEGIAYTVAAVTYYTQSTATVYDVCMSSDTVYVLAQGTHGGEIVLRFRNDGRLWDDAGAVWPVYSDASDIANPESRFIDVDTRNSFIVVGQKSTLNRIKRFTTSGTFLNQWNAGLADRELSGLATSSQWGSSVNDVYVTDDGGHTVRRYNPVAGTQITSWPVIYSVGGYMSGIRPYGNLVYITRTENSGGEVYYIMEAYTSTGTLSFTPVSRTGLQISETGAKCPQKISITQNGVAHVAQSDPNSNWMSLRKWRLSTSGTNSSSLRKSLIYTNGMKNATVSYQNGIMYAAGRFGTVRQYAAAPYSLEAFVLYYIGLAGSNIPVQIGSLPEPGTGALKIPGWSGNVWEQLSDFAAVYGFRVAANDNKIYVNTYIKASFSLPRNVEIEPLAISTEGVARGITVTNLRTERTGTAAVVYSALADGNRVIRADINSLDYITVSQGISIDYVMSPSATSSSVPGDGQYVVVDQNNVTVSATNWRNYGGAVVASRGDKHDEIVLKIVGPGLEIPGTTAPYRLSTRGGNASLSVIGHGISTSPVETYIGNGVSESVSNRENGGTLESPFFINADITWRHGSWAAELAGEDQRIQFRFSAKWTPAFTTSGGFPSGTSDLVGSLVLFEDAYYCIERASWTEGAISIDCYRYSPAGQPTSIDPPAFEEIWSGKTAAEFENYWNGYTAQDVGIAPYRNPFDDPVTPTTTIGGLFPDTTLYPDTALYPVQPVIQPLV